MQLCSTPRLHRLDHGNPVHDRHLDIRKDHIRLQAEDQFEGLTEQATAIEEILGGKRDMSLESQKSTGIGIRNVVARMYMFYGEELDINPGT